MFYQSLISSLSFFGIAAAQAPVSDLTGYPSGLASIAVVGYYAVSSDKDMLPHRRRIAGMGMEHLARDLARGPRRGKDARLKGILLSRQNEKYQRTAWARRVCGNRSEVNGATGVPHVDSNEITKRCAKALADVPESTQRLLEKNVAFGEDGHWLAATAAFCQIVNDLPGGAQLLHQCQQQKDDWDGMIAIYHTLQTLVDGRTNTVEMPFIQGKNVTSLESLMIRVDTWEGGGRPVYISCQKFLRILGHCAGFSYGELLLGAHANLNRAQWAAEAYVEFSSAIEITSSQDEIISATEAAIHDSCFYARECDLRVWGHRFGDSCASLVSGCIIAALVSLGSTAGSWVAVTAAAVADPKPVAGLTSAAWGYPAGRRAHFEARSRPINGRASVSVKRHSWLSSFDPAVCQDVVWQLLVGLVSVMMLCFKFPLRKSLGFGPFSPPQEWIFWFGVACAGLGVLISIQIPVWARQNTGHWGMIHGLSLLALAAVYLALRLFWRRATQASILSFWVSDACVWLYCICGSWFSAQLSESTDYPPTGWIWPSIWMLALASCGAGVPRALPST